MFKLIKKHTDLMQMFGRNHDYLETSMVEEHLNHMKSPQHYQGLF